MDEWILGLTFELGDAPRIGGKLCARLPNKVLHWLLRRSKFLGVVGVVIVLWGGVTTPRVCMRVKNRFRTRAGGLTSVCSAHGRGPVVGFSARTQLRRRPGLRLIFIL